MVVVLTCLIASSASLIVRRLPAVYEAGALILVDPQKIPDRFVSSTISEDFADRLATMNQEILSSTRLKKIINEFNLYPRERATHVMDEIIDMMRKEIQVMVEKSASANRPGAFRITYRAANPVLAARVVDRITQIYIDENLKDRELQSEGTSEFLHAQLAEAKRALDEQEAAVSRYKIQHNGELPEQAGALESALSRLQTQLGSNEDAINRAKQDKITLESAITASKALENALQSRRERSTAVGIESASMGRPAAPRRESDILAAQLENARMRYGDDHPDVRRLRDQLAGARQRESEEARVPQALGAAEPRTNGVNASGDPDALQAHEHTAELQSQLESIRQEIDRRQGERERITSEISSYEQRIGALPLREQEYVALTRDYDFSKANYRGLLDKKMAAEMATDLEKHQEAERFRILDAARPPERPVKPNRELLYGVSLFAALVLAMAASVLVEMRKAVLLGEWELPAGTPIVARISRIEGRSHATTGRTPLRAMAALRKGLG